MKHLALGLLVALQALPAAATELGEAQKLPVDLPSVLIRGEDETAGPLMPGNKLPPDDPGAMAFSLPRPRTALDLDRYLLAASESVDPGIRARASALPAPVPGYLAARLGAFLARRFELGLYGGHAGVELASRSWTVMGEAEARQGAEVASTLGDWHRLRLSGEAASEGLGLTAGYRQAGSVADVALREAHAQALELGGSFDAGSWAAQADLDLGRVGTPLGLGDGDEERLALGGRMPWAEAPGGHTIELAGSLGLRRTQRQVRPAFVARVQDRWELAPQFTLAGALDLGWVQTDLVADPSLELRYSPVEATTLALGLKRQLLQPTFSELYLERRYVAHNGELLPERTAIALEAAAGQRLDDRWYALATLSYARADRVIAWRQAPGIPELWQPFNPGHWDDTVGAQVQGVFSGELSAQYQPWGTGSQRFYYRWRSVAPLGAIAQEAGTSHQSAWWDARLLVELGARVRLEQLGATQVGGLSATGVQALVEGGLSYRLNHRMAAYLKLEGLPIAAQAPAANYYAPDALAVVGLKLDL